MITAVVPKARHATAAALAVREDRKNEPLGECVRGALSDYLSHLDGHPATDLYQMVLAEVEPPLLQTVMAYTQGNQTRAAMLLGISRSTLRKKLTRYRLTDG